MTWKRALILAAVLGVMILWAVLIWPYATAQPHDAASAITSTVIPAPEVFYLKCVRGMAGIYCEEVTAEGK